MKYHAYNNSLMNWAEYPILRLAVCFVLGIICSDKINISLDYLMLANALFLGLTLLLKVINSKHRSMIRMTSLLLFLLTFGLGWMRGDLQKIDRAPHHFAKNISEHSVIIGKIVGEVKHKNTVSAEMEVCRIDDKIASGQLLLYFNKKDTLIDYDQGDVLRVTGKVQALRNNANPHAFDYANYLKYQGIGYQVFLKSGHHHLLKRGGSNYVIDKAHLIRKWAIGVFEKRLTDQDQLATAAAMVLGYRDFLSKDMYATFSETGAVHVLAVSGLHVGIICLLFVMLFNRIKSEHRLYKWIKFITLIFVVWTYTMITGASPAVVRAAVMFSLILMGRIWYEGVNIYNILALSAVLILTFDPYLLFQLSFQFSYLALISILFFQPLVDKIFEMKHWVTIRLWQLISVSIAAQVLIFPISIFYFHKFPIYFILSGVVAVFLATFILAMGLIVLMFDKVKYLGDFFGECYSWLLEFFIRCIYSIRNLPNNTIDGMQVSHATLYLMYLFIGCCMFLVSLKSGQFKDIIIKKSGRKRFAIAVLGLSVLGVFLNHNRHFFRVLNDQELIVYDVSRGSLIDIFDGSKAYNIESNQLSSFKSEFACQGNRIWHGDPTVQSIDMNEQIVSSNFIYNANGILLFKDKLIVMVHLLSDGIGLPLESNILLVSHGTDILPSAILKSHATDLVVLDNSLNYKIKNYWLKESERRGIKVHDIAKDGVFVLK